MICLCAAGSGSVRSSDPWFRRSTPSPRLRHSPNQPGSSRTYSGPTVHHRNGVTEGTEGQSPLERSRQWVHPDGGMSTMGAPGRRDVDLCIGCSVLAERCRHPEHPGVPCLRRGLLLRQMDKAIRMHELSHGGTIVLFSASRRPAAGLGQCQDTGSNGS